MILRVNCEDPGYTDIGFDTMTGEQIMAYNGILFTGVEECYYPDHPQQLWSEVEYKEGIVNGFVREYHKNGQLATEYFKGPGVTRDFRRWDVQGNSQPL